LPDAKGKISILPALFSFARLIFLHDLPWLASFSLEFIFCYFWKLLVREMKNPLPGQRARKEKKKEIAAGLPLVHILKKGCESNSCPALAYCLLLIRFEFYSGFVFLYACAWVDFASTTVCFLFTLFLSISNPQLWKGKFYYGTLAWCALFVIELQKNDKIYCEHRVRINALIASGPLAESDEKFAIWFVLHTSMDQF
jgi:hypothetical protein